MRSVRLESRTCIVSHPVPWVPVYIKRRDAPSTRKRFERCLSIVAVTVQVMVPVLASHPPRLTAHSRGPQPGESANSRFHCLICNRPSKPAAGKAASARPAGFWDQQRDSARNVGHRIVIGWSPTLRHPWRPLSRSRVSGARRYAVTVDLSCGGTPCRMPCERVSA